LKDSEKEIVETNGEATERVTETHEPTHHHVHGEHHRHHHHHHRSHKRKTKNSRKKENFSRFFRRNKKYLLYAAITIVLVVCLLLLGGYLDRQGVWHRHDTDEPQGGDNTAVQTLKIGVPYFTEDVVIVGPAVAEFVNAAADVSVSAVYDRYRAANDARLDVGLAVTLSYELSDLPEGVKITSARFLVSEEADLRSPQVYTPAAQKNSVDVYHLKTGMPYYYRVDLAFSDGNVASAGGSFRTADTPRVLTVDGVYNLRDIGGWKTASGKRIKQGLLYRGCELDGAVESKYTITDDGVHTMLSVLGIKTDMDLRLSTDNAYGTDALGAGVAHKYYEAPMYSAVFNNSEKVRKIFSDLAVESHYPVYLHCTYGQDRTGTVCYLLEALLGVDEVSLMKDYQLSGLHHGGVSADEMSEFVGRLKGLSGATMQEKVEGYLLSIGVTAEEIASIRHIFLGGTI